MDTYPTTIDEAVQIIKKKAQPELLNDLKNTALNDLIKFHCNLYATPPLARQIRNKFGLWNDSSPLRDVTGKEHADGASMVIIEALWKDLNNTT